MKQKTGNSWLMYVVVALTISLFAIACSTSSGTIINNGNADGDTETSEKETSENADGDDDSTETSDNTDGNTTTPGACQEFEDGCCEKDSDCTKGECYEGVCTVMPNVESTLWWEDYEYDEEGEKDGRYRRIQDQNGDYPEIDLSCAETFKDLKDQDNAGTTKVNGHIKVFGVKTPCTTVKTEVFHMYNADGSLRTEFPESDVVVSGIVEGDADPITGQCPVTINDVPLGRWLVFKSYDFNGSTNKRNELFKDSYQFDVYIRAEDGKSEGYDLEINAISVTSWGLVPSMAGVSNGIATGRGAIAGTIKDCQGRLLKDANVGLTVLPTKLAYFNSNVSNLLPDRSLNSSNVDGTFSAVNQPSEVVRIVAVANVKGEIKKVGKRTVVMMPDSVSVVSFKGGAPMNYGIFDKSKVQQ